MTKIEVIQAPNFYHHMPKPYVFLAGSIEMGQAVDWQSQVTRALQEWAAEYDELTFTILNPRRDDWDSSWTQSIDNIQFREQVMWELKAMEDSDLVLMNFVPGTQSPITLLELGLRAQYKGSGSSIICCPEGFWRKGNVDIVSREYDLRWTVDTLEDLISAAKKHLGYEQFLEEMESRS